MRRLALIILAVFLIVSAIAVEMADESYTISEYSGASQSGPLLLTPDLNWSSAPADPQTVYVEVISKEPCKGYVERAMEEVIRSHGLRPVVDDVSKHDLKGRVVLVYIPMIRERRNPLFRELSVSGILYYSYAGDARSVVSTIGNLTLTKNDIGESAQELCQISQERLGEERIANQSCAVAYWWNLKAKVGGLRKGEPCGMIAGKIASQLDEFLRND